MARRDLQADAPRATEGQLWEFESDEGWLCLGETQHRQVHAAWLAMKSTVTFTVHGTTYRVDFRKLVQKNLDSRKERKVRPPANCVQDMLVTNKRPAIFYIRAAASMLRGSEEQDPFPELRIAATGNAIPAAVAAATSAEKDGLGSIWQVKTDTINSNQPRIVIQVRSEEAVARARSRRWKGLLETVDNQVQKMPRLNFLRLIKEFRKVEETIRKGQATSGLVRCEPVDDNLMEWEADMLFPGDSPLQRSLDNLAVSAGEASKKHLTLRVRFPLDYPLCPPEVWVLRPRLRHRCAPVTFSGRLCSHLLGSSGWEPSSSMPIVFDDVSKCLLEACSEVDAAVPVRRDYLAQPNLSRLKTELFPVANFFEHKGMTVISPTVAEQFLGDLSRLEVSDKVGLPFEFADQIFNRADDEDPDLPLTFEIKTAIGRKKHCAIFDFLVGLPSMHILLPRWLMDDLCIDEWEKVALRGVILELISSVKVQPHSVDFYKAVADSGREVHELLTESLSRFSALTEDTSVPIEVGSEAFNLQILELQPRGAVRIIDSDVRHTFEFKVDFEPAPDLEDEEAMKARQERLIAAYKQQKEEQEAQRTSVEEKRQAALKRRFETAKERAREAAGEDNGTEGSIEIALRMPNSSQVKGRFREGAPVAAIMGLALGSEWASASCPWGIQLKVGRPPRTLTHGETVTQELHRTVVNVVEEKAPETDEDLYALVDVDDGGHKEFNEVEEPVALPPLLLERNISQVQRRTEQAFEVQRFMRAGYDPEEALHRYQNGEILPPCAVVAKATPSPPAAFRRQSSRSQPSLQRTLSADDRRGQQVEEVMGFTGVEHAAALEALEVSEWNTELAVNNLLDGLHD